MEQILGGALEIAAGFVKDRVQEHSLEQERKDKKKDFLDVLLAFQGNKEDEPNKISRKNLNVFILELFIGATETTNSTTEWAMTELLRNPESMNRAKEELDKVVGWERKGEENDIGQLQYLQAVLKETLRLHPPTPLLLPRRAVEDTELTPLNDISFRVCSCIPCTFIHPTLLLMVSFEMLPSLSGLKPDI
ncbi:cytochrome P450 76A2-like [Macadamia integrifolia]|uniref:cytochrome P450 76A2-like n=1 Tax=Macadamia integrifolia TaxID=60698 RepID=UPI001C4F252C|nr:cytochrome P450 76A2-like [Macadamia integrifolia]